LCTSFQVGVAGQKYNDKVVSVFVRKIEFSAEENIPAFLENFDESIKKRIRSAPGNRLIELYGQRQQKVYFLRSYWETEEDLENYRNSEFLMKYGFTKNYSNAKAEAWSVDKLASLV
jgi:heme-degrading monooxygenase HmoA